MQPAPRKTISASRGALLAVVLIAQFMAIIDISAVNVALPDMAKDLGIRGADISWTITSYSLLFGSLLLLGGRAAAAMARPRPWRRRPGDEQPRGTRIRDHAGLDCRLDLRTDPRAGERRTARPDRVRRARAPHVPPAAARRAARRPSDRRRLRP